MDALAIELDGFSLTRDEVIRASRPSVSGYAPVAITPASEARCARIRERIEGEWLGPIQGGEGVPIYGFNTGVGILKNRQVPRERLEEFQRRYIQSHCVGAGDAFDVETVRAAILVRLNSLVSGYSGVRVELLHGLRDLLNRGVHPLVPAIGSLGASGDLAPLAHVGAVLTGEPEAMVIIDGAPRRLADLPAEARPAPLTLAPKEAMALTNGTSFMLAVLVLLLEDASALLRAADLVTALSVEAMMGEADAFDARLHSIRGQHGQEIAARNIRLCLRGGEPTCESLRRSYLEHKIAREVSIYETEARAKGIDPGALRRLRLSVEHLPRVQDAYSLRCAPQVHGASRDALTHVAEIAERELNAVTDNPLIFVEGDGWRALSGGNFHGQPLALAADYAAIALAELGSISERRLYRLLNSELSYGLPPNLTGGEPGINTGLMITQYTAAALVSESKTLAHPASVDSIPTSGDQEDHVSMGLWACRKARRILENSRRVLSLELLAAAQGVDLQERLLARPRRLGAATAAARAAVRDAGIATLEEDRYLHADMERVHELLSSGELHEKVRPVLEEPLAGLA